MVIGEDVRTALNAYVKVENWFTENTYSSYRQGCKFEDQQNLGSKLTDRSTHCTLLEDAPDFSTKAMAEVDRKICCPPRWESIHQNA